MTQLSGELDGLLLLLKELSDLDYWVDGCFRVIKYCVQNNHLRFILPPPILNLSALILNLLMFMFHCICVSSAIVLFKQLKDKFESDEIQLEVLFDSVSSGFLLT